MNYSNLATSQAPAHIIYVIGTSGSMAEPMPAANGRKIDVVSDILDVVFRILYLRSLMGRYQVALFAYDSSVREITANKFISDGELMAGGPPAFGSLGKQGINTLGAMTKARDLLHRTIGQFGPDDPVPVVCHVTDGQYTSEYGNPAPVMEEIMNLEVPDGKVLLEQVFLGSGILRAPLRDLKDWQGVEDPIELADPYARFLYQHSSCWPADYAEYFNNVHGFSFKPGAKMFFPAEHVQMLEMAFSASAAAPTSRRPPRWPGAELVQHDARIQLPAVLGKQGNHVARPGRTETELREALRSMAKDNDALKARYKQAEELLARYAEREAYTKKLQAASGREITELRTRLSDQEARIRAEAVDRDKSLYEIRATERAGLDLAAEAARMARLLEERSEHERSLLSLLKAYQQYSVSVSHPRKLSKRFASRFAVQLAIPEMRTAARAEVASILGPDASSHQYAAPLRCGQTVRIKLYSPDIVFPEPKVKKLDYSTNLTTFLAKPADNCVISPAGHDVEVAIVDDSTGVELLSRVFQVEVVDFVVDHLSRPLLSQVGAVILALASAAMYILTFLEQIDKTIGLASGTAAAMLAAGIYASFYSLFQRVRPNGPAIL